MSIYVTSHTVSFLLVKAFNCMFVCVYVCMSERERESSSVLVYE